MERSDYPWSEATILARIAFLCAKRLLKSEATEGTIEIASEVLREPDGAREGSPWQQRSNSSAGSKSEACTAYGCSGWL